MYTNFPRRLLHTGGSILGISMVHFVLCLMHSHAQNPGLELCPPESVVSSVGLSSFFNVGCDLMLQSPCNVYSQDHRK